MESQQSLYKFKQKIKQLQIASKRRDDFVSKILDIYSEYEDLYKQADKSKRLQILIENKVNEEMKARELPFKIETGIFKFDMRQIGLNFSTSTGKNICQLKKADVSDIAFIMLIAQKSKSKLFQRKQILFNKNIIGQDRNMLEKTLFK